MFSASLAGAAVASTLSVLRNDSLYNNTVVVAWLAWFSEQFSTTLLLLPVLMAAPRLKQLLRIQVRWRLKGCLPLLALLLSLIFSVYIGGPGAIAFPIPALLWCAVRYQLFPVTLLTLLTGMTEISSISANLVLYETPNNHNAFLDTLMSARLGIAMLVMGPLILASSIAANRKLMRRLEHSANHDFLTGVLARSDDAQSGRAAGAQAPLQRGGVAPADRHRPFQADQRYARPQRRRSGFGVICAHRTARAAPRSAVRPLGRGRVRHHAAACAGGTGRGAGEHLRRLVEQAELQAEGKQTLKITISVGVASLAMNEVKSLEQLMNMADIALYRAKSQGRNRVESFNVVNGNSVEHILFR